MAYLALSPVSAAVYTALNVAGLQALVSTRIYDGVPANPAYPFVLFEVQEREQRGFGTGGFPEVEVRVHAFDRASNERGPKTVQTITAKVIELLRDQALTVSGYTQAGRVFYDETVPLPQEQIAGVPVREMVSLFRIYLEEA